MKAIQAIPKINSRIAFLDYLRIFAFMSVLIGHKFISDLVAIINNPNIHVTARTILGFLLPLFSNGGAGVVVFFLVSGYIITHVIQTEQPLEFLIKRCFRVFPLYMAAVLIEVAIKLSQGEYVSVSVIIPRLLLIGDFTGTPYGLAGVEWTLRAEIMFYVFMFLLRYLKIIHIHVLALPIAIILATILLYKITPIPHYDYLFKGYFTIYAPFLFIGSMFYLYEKQQISLLYLLVFIVYVFIQYFKLIAKIQPAWIEHQFAILGFITFVVLWLLRHKIKVTGFVLLLSDLTFTVYFLLFM